MQGLRLVPIGLLLAFSSVQLSDRARLLTGVALIAAYFIVDAQYKRTDTSLACVPTTRQVLLAAAVVAGFVLASWAPPGWKQFVDPVALYWALVFFGIHREQESRSAALSSAVMVIVALGLPYTSLATSRTLPNFVAGGGLIYVGFDQHWRRHRHTPRQPGT